MSVTKSYEVRRHIAHYKDRNDICQLTPILHTHRKNARLHFFLSTSHEEAVQDLGLFIQFNKKCCTCHIYSYC